MRKLLMLIGALIICDAYGESVFWFTDDNTYTTDTCNSGDNLAKPANPTKDGYRFIGWKEPDNPKPYVSKILETNGTSRTPASSTTNDTWTVTFSWGTLTGKARCSSVSGTIGCWNSDATGASCTTNANPTTTDTTPNNNVINYSGNTDIYCWCKMTDSDGLVDVSSLAWVFAYSLGSVSSCAPTCVRQCGYAVQNYSGFRRAVFGVTQ